MDNKTIVLPSARAIRHEQLSEDNTALFLPNYITMSEFISKLTIVDGYKYLDEDSRVLLLLEASDFKNFTKLQIERNFFTFTKNSSYIFKFYEELSAELYDIENLSSADVYGEYEEHIEILRELYQNYERLCSQRKLLDKIFLPKLYRFNDAYVKRTSEIELHVDGYLTNFEFELLDKAAQVTQLKIIFTTTQFNKKMQEKFKDLGFDLAIGYKYTIDFTAKETLSKERTESKKSVTCSSVSEGLLQVAFIKSKIYEFVEKGYAPEKIAVILPNESSAKLIKSFDEKSNLNFAMGESFRESQIYKKIDATMAMIDQDTCENEARLERVGDELYLLLRQINRSTDTTKDFIEYLKKIKELFSVKKELEIYEQEIHSFEKLLPFVEELSPKSLLSLFMSRLASQSIDDVRGGKITVMGLLETRNIEFDGVIIIDFDDNNVPKRSDKDMFLNSKIREIALLPTMSDRENLQKHYYEMLLSRSRESALCYVDSKESSGSRFLKQLGITKEKTYDDNAYGEILFKRAKHQERVEKEIVVEYSFKEVELSASRLKSYLTCKQKYYNKYILKLQEHAIPRDMPQEHEIGTTVHKALASLYAKKNSYSDLRELRSDLEKELDALREGNEFESYLIALQKRRLAAFCEAEIERFSQGYKVVHVEKKFSEPYAGMTISGVIDRVDKRDNIVEVLDYKTGSYTLYTKNSFSEATDFQLEFYYLLAGGLGNVEACGFYDLKEAKIVPEAFLQEKLEILGSHIKDLLQVQEIEVRKTDDVSQCKFCEYALMCGRD